MAFTTNYRTLPGVRANSTGLATSQFKIVKMASTAGQVVLNATAVFAGNIVGVLQNAPGANEEAEVAIDGICKVLIGTSTIVIGDGVGCNTTSQGTDAGTTDNLARIGHALEAGAASGDIISVLLVPGGWRY